MWQTVVIASFPSLVELGGSSGRLLAVGHFLDGALAGQGSFYPVAVSCASDNAGGKGAVWQHDANLAAGGQGCSDDGDGALWLALASLDASGWRAG